MKQDKLLILTFLFISFLVYFNSLSVPFYFDDNHMIVKNLFIKNPKYLPLFFKGYVTSYAVPKGMCRPLLMLTFFINYWAGGLAPLGYHLTNIFLHFLCAVVLYLLLKELTNFSSYFLSLITILFIVHPLNTEAVNYISSRSDLMSTLFVGVGLLCYIQKKYLFSLISYSVALLSKETALTLIFIIASYEFVFVLKNFKITSYIKLLGKKKFLFFLFFILITTVYLIYRQHFFLPPASKNVVPVRSPYANFLLQSFVSFFYLKLFISPLNLNLTHSLPDTSLASPYAFLSVLGIISLITLIIYLKKKYPLSAFGIAYYLCGLIPKFYAALNYPAMEHHFYMPSWGVYIVLCFLLYPIFIKHKKYFSYISLGIILTGATLTFFRNWEWEDKFRFWKVALERDPKSEVVHNQLGLEYLKRRDIKSAQKEFEYVLSITKTSAIYTNARANLAGVYRLEGKFKEALKLLKSIVKESSFPPPGIYQNLGIIYSDLGKEKKMLKSWQEEFRRYPRLDSINALLGLYYLKHNKDKKARYYLKRAVAFGPTFYLGYYGLAELAFKNKKFNVAANLYRKSIKLNFNFPAAHYGLGKVMLLQGNSSSGLKELLTTIKLDPKFSEAYVDLAIFYALLSNWQMAENMLKKAEELKAPIKDEVRNLIREKKLDSFKNKMMINK